MKVGLDDRFIEEKPARQTEGFPLIDTAFTRDDELGVTWAGQQGSFYWMVSLSNGLALGQQAPSEDRSYKLIHDNRQTGDTNQNKEIGLGLGWKYSSGKDRIVNVLGFGYTAKLSEEDIAFLQSVTGYGASGSDNNSMYGASIEYKSKSLSLGGKYIRARDGVLDRYGWFAQAFYRTGLAKGKVFNSITPLVRYGRLKVDHVPTDAITWDREMLTVALLTETTKGLMIKTEYYLNDETTGGDEVNNDEFLMQLEINF